MELDAAMRADFPRPHGVLRAERHRTLTCTREAVMVGPLDLPLVDKHQALVDDMKREAACQGLDLREIHIDGATYTLTVFTTPGTQES